MLNELEPIYRLSDVYFCHEKDLKTFLPFTAPTPTLENTSFYAEEDGCLYHYCGNTRIKVNEHFSDRGKGISTLIENVILHIASKPM